MGSAVEQLYQADAPRECGFHELGEFHQKAYARGYLYDVPVCEGVAGARLRRDQREFINLASISFMGFQEEPDVINYFCEASRRHGLVTGGSRMTQGVGAAHAALEARMSRLTQCEYTLTFGSGLLANIGFLNALTTRFSFDGDCFVDNREAVMVLDRDSHWSLWKGCSHLRPREHLLHFQHNDPRDLDAVLSGISSPRKVVIFESVYSSDGGVAPIGALLDVCEKHGALSYVDDANGFMIYGRPNRPYHADYQELGRATFRMVSFSKAVGLEGGAISGPREYVQPMEVLSGTSLFTAAMQPPTAATALYIINRLESEPELMDSYLAKVAAWRRHLLEEGFQLHDTESYILSVFIGQDQAAELVRQFLYDAGFMVPVFRYPAVRRNQAVLRLILNNRHSQQELESFITTLRAARQRFGF
jgi:8-amino-7-oxononanoate synthase